MLRWVFLAVLSGFIALVACFPMRWAAGWILPDEIKAVAPNLNMRGTIWKSTLSGLPLFGTANVNIAPLSRRVNIRSGSGSNYLAGSVTPAEAADVDFRLNLSTVPFTDGRLQGLQGTLVVQISEMKIEEKTCQSVDGIARTDVLQRNGGTIDWTGPELTGPIRCEAGSLIADLSGKDAQQSISAIIRIIPDGSYRADIDVRTVRVEADAVLPLFGFSRSGQSFVLTEQGNWR